MFYLGVFTTLGLLCLGFYLDMRRERKLQQAALQRLFDARIAYMKERDYDGEE